MNNSTSLFRIVLLLLWVNSCRISAQNCGEIIEAQNGVIEYKVNEFYNNYERCVWTIRNSNYSTITFRKEATNLENGFDFLAAYALVHQVASCSSQPVSLQERKFSTNDSEETFNLTGSVAFLVFTSDPDNTGKGFRIHFEWNGPLAVPLNHFDFNTGDLSGSLKYPWIAGRTRFNPNELSTFVISSNYTNFIDGHNSNPIPTKINLRFTYSDIDGGSCNSNCRGEALYIININEDGSPSIKSFCGGKPSPQTGNLMILVFHTNNNPTGSSNGFRFEWNH